MHGNYMLILKKVQSQMLHEAQTNISAQKFYLRKSSDHSERKWNKYATGNHTEIDTRIQTAWIASHTTNGLVSKAHK